MTATILVSLVSAGIASFKPSAYLGGDLFAAYRGCVDGARFDNASKSYLAPVARATAIVSRLQVAGFAVIAPESLQTAVVAAVAEVHATVANASARAAKVDADLKSKGLALYGFQRGGVQWLASRSNGLLADEMGLGKTIQTLIALPTGARVVVVCPAVAKGVWAREAAKWRPELKITTLKGRGNFVWPAANEIVIINYDILPAAPKTDSLPTIEAPADVVLVADEAHALKSAKAKRTASFRALATGVRAAGGKVWLLTATPLLNRPQELWSIFQAADLAREAFGSWNQFVTFFCGRAQKWGGFEWGTPDASVGERIRRVMLRRLRTEVLPDLPVKTYQEISASLDRAVKRECDEVMEECGNDVQKLVNSEVSFKTMSRVRAALATAKIPALLELVETYEESSEPVVVFSYHRSPLNELAKRDGWAAITGDTSPEERSRVEARFQAGELRGVAATIAAGGVAITLTKAAHAIFVDLAWTPALNAQAEDRICRIGQTRGCVVTRIVGDHSLDQLVTRLLSEKQALINASVELGANAEVVLPSVPDFAAAEPAEPVLAPAQMVASGSPAVTSISKARRQAGSECEEWAGSALLQLAADDQDHAAEENGVGFNRIDNSFGHSLAQQLATSGLTDKQWTAAIKLCRKYQGQVGEMPAEKAAS